MSRKRRRSTAGASPSYLTRSLEYLEGGSWGDPTYDSYVVRTVHALRHKPLNTLTDEELRLGLSQRVGLKYLVPLALDRLRVDPFRAGDFHPGDVLHALPRVPEGFWSANQRLRQDLEGLAATALAAADGRAVPDVAELTQAWERFAEQGKAP